MKKTSALLLLILVAAASSCKIVRHDTLAQNKKGNIEIFFADSGFDPKAYVKEIWDPKIMPYLAARSVDIALVLDGIKNGDSAVLKKYGYKVGDEGSFYNFSVKGKFRVLRVNTESRNGLAYVDAFPYDGKEDCILQIGPVFKGSSIRDVLDFISLNSFENQVEFAQLATELNYHVRDSIVKGIDFAAATGKVFDMTAVFTYGETADMITLTPVAMQSAGE